MKAPRSAQIIIAVSLACLSLSAVGAGSVASCVTARPTAPEPVGDRAGHSIQVVTATCMETQGAHDGAITTIHAVWEQDLAASKLLSGHAVVRKARAVSTYHLSDGIQYPVMRNNRPVGWTATGHGTYTLASGVAAVLANRTFTWKAYSTGPHHYVLETHIDE